jgi:hypothetical protein
MPVAEAARRAATLIAAMRREFADAEVDGWQPLEGTFGLPDPDDEHVLAAAVIAGAGAIVTENLKDFPADRIPPGIQVLSAREFAKNTVALNPRLALAAVHEIASRSGRYGATLAVGEIRDSARQVRNDRSRRDDRSRVGVGSRSRVEERPQPRFRVDHRHVSATNRTELT